MDRRQFLAWLGFGTVAAAAAATSVFDVEQLLWVPGEKTIFLPPDRYRNRRAELWRETVDWIRGGGVLPNEVYLSARRRLANECVFAANVMRDYDSAYKDRGARIGATVTLRQWDDPLARAFCFVR